MFKAYFYFEMKKTMEFDLEKLCGFVGGKPKYWYLKQTITRSNQTGTIPTNKAINNKKYGPQISKEETLRRIAELLELDPKEMPTDDNFKEASGPTMIHEMFKLRRFFRDLLFSSIGSNYPMIPDKLWDRWMQKIADRTGWVKRQTIVVQTRVPKNGWWSDLRLESNWIILPKQKDVWVMTPLVLTIGDYSVRKLIHTELSSKYKLPKDVCNLITDKLGYPPAIVKE